MKTALLLIATGQRYWDYARRLMASADEYFVPHDTILFTDSSPFRDSGKIKIVPYEHYGYPEASYRRYQAFNEVSQGLSGYEQMFYCDVDMEFVKYVSEDEIFSDDITATEHPGYVGSAGTPCKDPKSTAYTPKNEKYFCGGFQGGNAQAFLKMSKELTEKIAIDDSNGVQPEWIDEAQLNCYLAENPPAKILSPSFCYPEKDEYYKTIWAKAGRGPFEPKLIALEKGAR